MQHEGCTTCACPCHLAKIEIACKATCRLKGGWAGSLTSQPGTCPAERPGSHTLQSQLSTTSTSPPQLTCRGYMYGLKVRVRYMWMYNVHHVSSGRFEDTYTERQGIRTPWRLPGRRVDELCTNRPGQHGAKSSSAITTSCRTS